MNYVEVPIYPYRVHLLGGCVQRVFIPERDVLTAYQVLKNNAPQECINITSDGKLIRVVIDSTRIVSVDTAFGNEAMYIRNNDSKLSAISYNQAVEKKRKATAKKDKK